MKRTSLMIGVLLGCVLLFTGVSIVRVLYWQPQDRPWIRRLVAMVPVPVARVGGHWVRYQDYLTQQDATRAFLRSSVAQGEGLPRDLDARAKAAILDQLLRVAAVQDMSQAADVRLRAGEVDRMYQDILQRAGTSTDPGEISAYLQSTFGWSEEVFKERVVRPAVLETIVRQEVYKDDEAAFEKALEEKLRDAARYIRL